MPGPQLFLIDDEPDYCQDLSLVLGQKFQMTWVNDGVEALEHLKSHHPDIILLDVDLGKDKMSGLEILERIRTLPNPPPVLMLSGDQEVETVVRAIKIGAFHYAAKSADLPQLMNLIEKAISSRATSLAIEAHRDDVVRLTGSFVAGDKLTHRLLSHIEKVARTDATVLITGESGTGKEMVARRIHERSQVCDGPFVGINCGAIAPDIIEAEMFGHDRGAFTGADRQRAGKFEMAAGGTLFLDEIGDSPLPFQIALLRVLGERVFSRVGETSNISMNARIIAATSKDLESAIATGEFRSELYYRLNIYRIHLLPLNDRPGDILPLAENFLKVAASRFHKDIHGFSPVVQEQLVEHAWKGNVRELGNQIERAVLNCQTNVIGLGDIFQSGEAGETSRGELESYDDYKDRITEQWQLSYLKTRLTESNGNVTEAAKASGMPRQSFQRLMKLLGLKSDDFRV